MPLTATASVRERQLAELLARIARRAERWGWKGVYERWSDGRALSRFERKWLALSFARIQRRAAGDPSPMSFHEIARVRLWPGKKLAL
jgi:hypothetical protein